MWLQVILVGIKDYFNVAGENSAKPQIWSSQFEYNTHMLIHILIRLSIINSTSTFYFQMLQQHLLIWRESKVFVLCKCILK